MHKHPRPRWRPGPAGSSPAHRARVHARAHARSPGSGHACGSRGRHGLGVPSPSPASADPALPPAPPVQTPLCPSPAGLGSQRTAESSDPPRGSPRLLVPEPSKNKPGDKRADFLAHSPQPAAGKNLSLGLLPRLPFCLCLMPLPSRAVISNGIWSCFPAFPHIPLRHQG